MARTLEELDASLKKLEDAPAVTPQTSTSSVTVTKDRLREWKGPSTCPLLEWQTEAEAAIAEHGLELKPKEAAAYLVRKIKGDAAKEVRLEKETCAKSPKDLFSVLAEAYGSCKSATTLTREFYNRKQRANEKVLAFSHAISVIMEELEVVDKSVSEPVKGKMLQRHVAENVYSGQLRWELLKEIEKDSDIPFIKLRKTAMKWESDESRCQTSKYAQLDEQHMEESRQMKTRMQELEQRMVCQHETINAAIAKQTELMERMTYSFQQACSFATQMGSNANSPQPPLQDHRQGQGQAPSGNKDGRDNTDWKKRARCHWCREVGHIKKECEGYLTWKAKQQQGNGQGQRK